MEGGDEQMDSLNVIPSSEFKPPLTMGARELMDSTDSKAHVFIKMESPTKQEQDPFVKTEKIVNEEAFDFPKREKAESCVTAEPLVPPKIEKSERFGKTEPLDSSKIETTKPVGMVGEAHLCSSGKGRTYKKRNASARWTKQIRSSPGMTIESLLDDGFSWRKYGQKDILGSKFPRAYYRCTHINAQGCLATKQVQRSDEDPNVFEVTYRGNHTCKLDSSAAPPSQEQLVNLHADLKVLTEVSASSTLEKIHDCSLTDDPQAMDIIIEEHSNGKYIQLPKDTDAILHPLNTPAQFLMKKSGLGLTEPPKDEAWHSVVRMELADNKLSVLPFSPSSPELKVLMLQGNVELTRIPNTFFCQMPLLSILNLSYTNVRELPDSLFELEQLRELYLKGCECFMKLSPKIGKLKNLEKIDLDGTQIIHMPEEIQELTNLQTLFLCFYEYRGRKGKQYMCSTIIPSEVISKLKGLKHLSIDVNPDDERWYENVQRILPEILGLQQLLSLSLYIPHLELLESIPDHIFQVDFRFIVGRHMQRIISSTPSTCEAKFKQSSCSLKFVNGDIVPSEIQRLVRHSKALLVERHKTIKSLSEFKMMNLEQLRVCILAECREMQTVVDGRQSNRGYDIFSHLLYLYVTHMKSLRSIWEGSVPPHCFLGMLKSLVLQNCAELTTVFTMDFLGNLSLLKVLIVKDCPKVTTLISDGSFRHKIEVFLPKLRKILLLHLPVLINISNGCCIGPRLNKIAIYDCPKLQMLSKWELSSQSLKVIQGEMKWWDQLQWREEWGISPRPSWFDRVFSSIDNQVDIMTQIGNDNDDIDDDEDMTPLQTLLSHPKQNANRVRSVKQNAPKFSARTKSDVEVLDDGHKCRKYGTKTNKGSKYPSNYYRCAYEGCPVKKKVERCVEDPPMVVTTYVGIHTHTDPHSEIIASSEPLYPSNDKVDKDGSYMHRNAADSSSRLEDIFDGDYM